MLKQQTKRREKGKRKRKNSGNNNAKPQYKRARKNTSLKYQKKTCKNKKKTQEKRQHKRVAYYLAFEPEQAFAYARNTAQHPFWRAHRPPSAPLIFLLFPKTQENAHPGVYD